MLVSLGIGVLLAELVLRVVIPHRTTHSVWPPSMSKVFRPRAELYPDLPRETRFSINSRGVRGPEIGRDEEELRVLALGGSATECIYHDDPVTWTAQVGTLLSSRPGARKVWAGNAGRSGMNSGDHVLHAKHLLAELPRLDAAVLLVGVNDLGAALGKPESYAAMPEDLDHSLSEKAVRRAFFQVPGRLEDSWDYDASFLTKSQIYQLVKRIRRQRTRDLGSVYKLQDDNGDNMTRWREHRRTARKVLEELPPLEGALATFRANLTAISRIAKARGVPLTLMTQPSLWRADLTPAEQEMLWMGGVGEFQSEPGHDYYSVAALAGAMKMFNEVTLEVCREQGLSCVDLATVVPADSKIFYDDCHFGRTGADKIARAVADHLAGQAPFAMEGGSSATGRP